jgi:hypothetical protein
VKVKRVVDSKGQAWILYPPFATKKVFNPDTEKIEYVFDPWNEKQSRVREGSLAHEIRGGEIEN